MQARFGSLPFQQRLSGVVQAQKQVEIYPRISAPIEEVFKQDVDEAAESEPLVKLCDREFVSRVQQAEADPPRVRKFDPNNSPIFIIGAQSTRQLDELTQILENDISKCLEQVPGVGTIDVWGGIDREIRVNLKCDRLNASGLTAQDVRNAIVA